jgi:PKD repeat protein
MNSRIIIPVQILFYLIFSLSAHSQNWQTFGGNSTRSGLSKITGPQNAANVFWNVSSTPTTLGNAVYTFGDRFITSRVLFAPYSGRIECRDLQTGSYLWTSPFISSTSIFYAIGFTEDAVYAHDYNTDTIYALHPDDGTIKWRSSIKSQTFGAYPGAVFTCEGDLIVNAPVSSGKFTMRLNKATGDTVWTNPDLIAIGPAVGLTANETTVYRLTGGITLPILLTAIDINTGVTKYSSLPIPGDPDQENPITLGFDNQIFFWRDGGSLFAYEDVGNALVQNWQYIPSTTTGAALSGNISVDHSGNIYFFDNGKIRHVDRLTGVVIDSSVVSFNTGDISVGKDSTVYVNNKNGIFYALTPDLQTIKWQHSMGGNTYCNLALAKDGIMVLTGAGTSISAFKPSGPYSPVADFRSDSLRVFVNQPINFYDQSSYVPTSWEWSFPGAIPTSSTLSNPTGVIYSTPGIYEVGLIVTNSMGTDTIIKSCYLEVLPFTGNEDIQYMQVEVYPNPANNYLYLAWPQNYYGKKYFIHDLSGRLTQTGLISSNKQLLYIAGWSNGIYVLTTEDQPGDRQKIVKY